MLSHPASSQQRKALSALASDSEAEASTIYDARLRRQTPRAERAMTDSGADVLDRFAGDHAGAQQLETPATAGARRAAVRNRRRSRDAQLALADLGSDGGSDSDGLGLGHQRASTLPAPVAAVLQVLASLGALWMAYSLLQEWARPQLLGVVRHLSPGDLGVLLGWRGIYTAFAWFSECSAADAAAVGFLGTSPTVYLLATFYQVPPTLALAALAVDSAVVFELWSLFRSLSQTPAKQRHATARPRGTVTSDVGVQLATSVFAAAIYAVVIFLAFQSFVPRLVLGFLAGGQTLTAAFPFDYATILPAALAFGAALNRLVFVPYADLGLRREDAMLARFDPAAATLWETVVFNFWGYTARAKVGLRRTLAAMLSSGIGTCAFLLCGLKTTHQGAVAYASIWVAAALFAGIGMGWAGKL